MRMTAVALLLGVVLFGCDGDDDNDAKGPQQPLTVSVVDYLGQAMANATVVVGDREGAIQSYLSTNELGEAHFDEVPPDATVTAAYSCYAPAQARTNYFVDAVYAVNMPSLRFFLGSCGQSVTPQVVVDVANQIAGVTFIEVTLGPITLGADTAAATADPEAMDVYEVQSDGNVSVVAVGLDESGTLIGYGLALDRPAVQGTAISVVIDRTDLGRHTHGFANVPASASGYFVAAGFIRKQATTIIGSNTTGGGAPLPDSVTTYSTGSFAEHHLFLAGVTLDRDSDGNGDAELQLTRYQRDPSDQTFDFSLTPLVPGDLAFDAGVNGRPVISWSNSDSTATVQDIGFVRNTPAPQKARYTYSITAPSSMTTLVFPELPDVVAAFRPEPGSGVSLGITKFARPATYGEYLAAVVNHDGRFYESEPLSSYGHTKISQPQ